MNADRLLDELNRRTARLANLADDTDEARRLRERVEETIEKLEVVSRLMDRGVPPQEVSRPEWLGLLSADDEAELAEYVDDLAAHRR